MVSSANGRRNHFFLFLFKIVAIGGVLMVPLTTQDHFHRVPVLGRQQVPHGIVPSIEMTNDTPDRGQFVGHVQSGVQRKQ